MVKLFSKLFESLESSPNQQVLSVEDRQLATAALLIEVAFADHDFDETERQELKAILQKKFNLEPEALIELTALAQDEQKYATSLYQFTQVINQSCSMNDKYELIKAMWEVAYIDGNIDKYEEHLIRKVSELLYVSHSDFIRAKQNAQL
ncbi:MAG: TerB family tellurite resistance protein [Cellvibrionaceae bacterium]